MLERHSNLAVYIRNLRNQCDWVNYLALGHVIVSFVLNYPLLLACLELDCVVKYQRPFYLFLASPAKQKDCGKDS